MNCCVVGQPSPRTSVLPAVTDDEYASAQVAELQFAEYLCWIREGEGGATVTDCDEPRVNESPRVSVGADGGLWFAHPTAYTRVLPEATFDEKARPQDAALQFDLYLLWTTEGEEGTTTDADAPNVNESPRVSVGTPEGGAWLGQLTASTRMFPAVTLEPKAAAQLAALQLATKFFCTSDEAWGISWTHFRLSRLTVTAWLDVDCDAGSG